MTTWRKALTQALEDNGSQWSDLEAITLSDDELDAEFDAGYGGAEGKPFTAWTNRHVYFPAVYDGAEWVASVSRHPDGQPTSHVGGQ